MSGAQFLNTAGRDWCPCGADNSAAAHHCWKCGTLRVAVENRGWELRNLSAHPEDGERLRGQIVRPGALLPGDPGVHFDGPADLLGEVFGALGLPEPEL